MRKYYITMSGRCAGPYEESKVARALKAGKIGPDAEIFDAQTGEPVLAANVLERVAPGALNEIASQREQHRKLDEMVQKRVEAELARRSSVAGAPYPPSSHPIPPPDSYQSGGPSAYGPPLKQPSNWPAKWGFGLGLASFVPCLWPLTNIVGIVFSGMGLSRAKVEGSKGLATAGLILAIASMTLPILAVAIVPKLTGAKEKLELKQMGDLQAALDSAIVDGGSRLTRAPLADAKGADLWIGLQSSRLVGSDVSSKLVSLMGNDSVTAPASHASISYTAPDGSELRHMIYNRQRAALGNRTVEMPTRDGGSRQQEIVVGLFPRYVAITWNSRNWRNAGGEKVPVVWSDSPMPEWLTFAEAQSGWGVTRAEWDDPAGKLFGKREPFLRTFE